MSDRQQGEMIERASTPSAASRALTSPEVGRSSGVSSWALLASVVAALALALVSLGIAQRIDSSPGFAIVLWGAILVSLVLSVYIHELGHLVAAIVLRCPIREVAVMARPDAKRRVVGRVPVRLGVMGKVSQVHAFPTPDASVPRLRLVVLYLAGAAANAIVGIAFYLAATGLATPGPVRGSLLTVAGVSVLVGLLSLAPVKLAGKPTDGANVVRCLRGRDGLATRLVLEDLRRRADMPGNRWRSFEDLTTGPEARGEDSRDRSQP